MNYENLIQIIFISLTYYLFSNEFYLFSSELIENKVSISRRFLCFIIVYIWFVIASLLELPLIINWFVFLIILGLEVHCVFQFEFLTSYALSMFCTIIGLAINIFFRSLLAIVMKVPLSVFDNTTASIKVYPILLGFLFMGVLFVLLRHLKFPKKLNMMLENKNSLRFYAWIEGATYLFLMIQLLAYSQTESLIGMKLWGIKASIFSIIILLITNIYTIRMASLNDYVNRQHKIHNQLVQEKEDINKLWKLAYVDVLTGCNNRQLLDKRLKEYASYGGIITLAFIDLNGLKMFNDQYGHLVGDQYLMMIAKTILNYFQDLNVDLFRYGGDEFVLMSNTLTDEEMTRCLEDINQELKNHKDGLKGKSISYGVVQGSSDSYKQLMKLADQLMYKHKKKYYEKMIRD